METPTFIIPSYSDKNKKLKLNFVRQQNRPILMKMFFLPQKSIKNFKRR